MIRGGKLRDRIRIERVTETQNSIGEVVRTWDKFIDLYVQTIPVSGAEVFKSGRETISRSARFLSRWFDGLTEKDRILKDGVVWDIVYIVEMPGRDGLEILAQVTK